MFSSDCGGGGRPASASTVTVPLSPPQSIRTRRTRRTRRPAAVANRAPCRGRGARNTARVEHELHVAVGCKCMFDNHLRPLSTGFRVPPEGWTGRVAIPAPAPGPHGARDGYDDDDENRQNRKARRVRTCEGRMEWSPRG